MVTAFYVQLVKNAYNPYDGRVGVDMWIVWARNVEAKTPSWPVAYCPTQRYAEAITKQLNALEMRAWDEDEADMSRIAREWRNFDTDPPGS